jgi:hypothetical protein
VAATITDGKKRVNATLMSHNVEVVGKYVDVSLSALLGREREGGGGKPANTSGVHQRC